MKAYEIEINEELNAIIEEGAKRMNLSTERFIAEILNRYAIDPHIMEGEEVKKGYEEMGDINLEISNH